MVTNWTRIVSGYRVGGISCNNCGESDKKKKRKITRRIWKIIRDGSGTKERSGEGGSGEGGG